MTEKFVSPAPPPSPFEREITECLIEECAEVQQRSTKLLRFGPTEVQPGKSADNAYRLGLEVGDLLEVIDLAVERGLIPVDAIVAGRANKRLQLARFLQHD